jgi:hypothetical protein
MATRERSGVRPPVDGAVRVHKLASARSGDPFGDVRNTLEARGWKVLEHDHYIGDVYTAYVMVHAWAFPPEREVGE